MLPGMPVTRNRGRTKLLLVTGFQAFQLVTAFQATLHWLAANSIHYLSSC